MPLPPCLSSKAFKRVSFSISRLILCVCFNVHLLVGSRHCSCTGTIAASTSSRSPHSMPLTTTWMAVALAAVLTISIATAQTMVDVIGTTTPTNVSTTAPTPPTPYPSRSPSVWCVCHQPSLYILPAAFPPNIGSPAAARTLTLIYIYNGLEQGFASLINGTATALRAGQPLHPFSCRHVGHLHLPSRPISGICR